MPEEKPPVDMDDAMILGCGSFLVASVLAYGLVAWPLVRIDALNDFRTILRSVALTLPAAGWAVYAGRKGGAAAFGAFAGSAAAAAFWRLRLQHREVESQIGNLPAPDYPEHLLWSLPLALVVLVGLACLGGSIWQRKQTSR